MLNIERDCCAQQSTAGKLEFFHRGPLPANSATPTWCRWNWFPSGFPLSINCRQSRWLQRSFSHSALDINKWNAVQRQMGRSHPPRCFICIYQLRVGDSVVRREIARANRTSRLVAVQTEGSITRSWWLTGTMEPCNYCINEPLLFCHVNTCSSSR